MTRETVLLVNDKFELATRDDRDMKLKHVRILSLSK